ncbi:MAG: DUF1345 domain-containing protein [Bradyrhizobium sp.]|nr:MAG: DUF1345 domain-containing protein [Bradyrhizobium sp.]
MSADLAAKARAGAFKWLRRRARLAVGFTALVIAFVTAPAGLSVATRALIAWNVGAWLFLALIALMTRGSSGDARAHAAEEDEDQWALLAVTVIGAIAAVAAIVWELGPVKDMSGLRKGEHIALVAATILSVWTFIHVMFGLHYAAEYYRPGEDGIRAGLRFPDEDTPGWGEFFYQAFVIGCACATADVNATSRAMRRACVIHGVVAFLFNTIILALTINIGAGLF